MEDFRKASDEELFLEYHRTHDVALRNVLLERYLYIARIIAKKFSGRGIDYEDLLQTASLALVRVIERFDPTRGIKFNSFATPSLIGEIKNYFRDSSRIIRMPRTDGTNLKRLNDAAAEYAAQHGEAPTAAWLAQKLDLPQEKILELLEMKEAGRVLSLDAAQEGDPDMNMMGLVGDEDAAFTHVENRDFLRYCLSQLNDQEKEIIKMRFVQNKTQSEVAAALNVSQMQVSRLERKILGKLKSKMKEA